MVSQVRESKPGAIGEYTYAINFAEGRKFRMLDFSCPVCGRQYHADESHIGKQIQCSNSKCLEIITIAWQDGRYTKSGQGLQTDNGRQEKGFSFSQSWNQRTALRKVKWNRILSLSSLAVLFVGLLTAWYILVHVRNNELGHVTGGAGTGAPETRAATVNPPSSILERDSGTPEIPVQSPGLSPEYQSQKTTKLPVNNPLMEPFTAEATERFHSKSGSSQEHMATSAPTHRESLPAVSLPTGTRIIADQATGGNGVLKALNGTPFDACVIAVDAGTQIRVRQVYIKANDSATLDRIDQGNYRIVFATGLDWDRAAEKFSRGASYFEFGEILSFQEHSDSERLHYERYTITLNPVINGNVRPRPISEAEFHILSGRR